jgi:tagaturonate reductase
MTDLRNPPLLDHGLVRSPGFAERTDLTVPDPALLDLPEKAVQFGTGAFLRGFVDFFLDEANRQGKFGGRIVAIGSTGSGRDQLLNAQDGLYTLSIQGVVAGEPRREHRVISSVSRALSAGGQWSQALAVARNPSLELIFSNTTEVGIALDEEDEADSTPPRSFPGKLTRFLYERARAFGFSQRKGVVVIPCELIADNGDRLRETVLALADRWKLGREFVHWIEEAVPFCNTLVDRIVPGAPSEEEREALRGALGYRDEILTTCEVYWLFAIEGDETLRARLGFADVDPGIVIARDIAPYRERKVRLLNGAHTITAPLALLCGCETVRGAVSHELLGRFVHRAVFDEIVPSVDLPDADAFGREVLERFANPFIRHALFDITLQQTMKMRVRVVPSIVRYADQMGYAPRSLAFGFAAYLLFMRGMLKDERRRAGLPVPADDQGDRLRALWTTSTDHSAEGLRRLAQVACGDESLWGTDLTLVPGFLDAVSEHLVRACRAGVAAALEAHLGASVERSA